MREPQESTTDVDPRFLHTVTIHGREFQRHAVENSIQFLPIDGEEVERLEAQHRILNTLFDERSVFPPTTSLRKVLDLGYGTAAWAFEVASQYTDCEVTGVDISLHMLPDEYPENFEPQLDDLNERFTFSQNHFDLVQSRLVGSGINKNRWASYVRDIVKALRPGGWCQMIEFYHMAQSDNGSLSADSALRQWSTSYMRSIDNLKDPRAPMQLQSMMQAAGLQNVESRMIPVPLCGWPIDARERRIGEMQGRLVGDTLRALSLYTLTTKLHMRIEDFDALIGRAIAEAADPKHKAYFPLYVCIGQKPST